MKQKARKDSRVTARRIPWQEYVVIFVVMLCLTGSQAMIFYAYVDISQVTIPMEFMLANIGYWGLMAFCVCMVTAAMRRRTYDKPMRMLSGAARQVAQGDFSVRLESSRKGDRRDYVDVMFEDFNSMAEELGTIETLKSDFIANVSHEIKTPLSVIQSYAMALQKPGITPQRQKEYTDTLIAAAQRLNALVTDILRLSKLENQQIQPSPERYDLCRQLCDCALSFEELWDAKNITFTADMDDRAEICADRSLLDIVWNNLLSNALKFTPPGGSVALTQTSDADTVTVTVADTGCGMSEETMRRIFDKFYQGDTSHAQEGNGLGLALTLRAVEIMGGGITVKSAPGEGSAFTVTLMVET